MKAPYLERQEEHDLAVLWRDKKDQVALHRADFGAYAVGDRHCRPFP